MKILMTTDTIGGVWTYAVELAAALAPRGVRVVLATMGAPVTDAQRAQLAAAAAANVTLEESIYRLEWMAHPWHDVRDAGQWLLELDRRHRPDLVHLNAYAHAALPFNAPVLVTAHSCVLSWWRAVKGEQAPAAEWSRYRREVISGLRAADLVVAPTHAMLQTVIAHYGPLPRTRVIPNARDPRHFHRGEKEPLILAAGRLWDQAKNIAALSLAAPDLPWPVYVAGDDTSPDGRVQRPAHLRPLGRLAATDIADLYARAAIYCLPARYEPFGLSALEAALSGCALVLGDIPSLREVWADAAAFVPPDDPAALRETLHSLIDDPLRRESLARAARDRARRYTPDRMATAYLDAYAHAVATRRATDRTVPGTNLTPIPAPFPIPHIPTPHPFAS